MILDRLASAPFSTRTKTAYAWDADELCHVIGMPNPNNGNKPVGGLDELTSWEAHTLQRVREGRWPEGTRPGEYLADLRAAAGHPDAELFLGLDPVNGHALAGTLTPLNAPGLNFRKAPNTEGMSMLVIYDATNNAIRTGFSDVDSTARKSLERWRNRRQLAK